LMSPAACKIIVWLVHHPQTSKIRLAIMNIVHTCVNWVTCLLWASKTVFWASCSHVIINPIITWVSLLLFSCSNCSENALKVSRLCKHNLQSQVSSTIPCLPHFAQSCWPRRHIIKHNHCWCTDTHLYRVNLVFETALKSEAYLEPTGTLKDHGKIWKAGCQVP
jgi:hypothetical protein